MDLGAIDWVEFRRVMTPILSLSHTHTEIYTVYNKPESSTIIWL